MDTHVVIMAGGIGSRLWPLSTPEKPKQFIDILGVGKSLLQLTVERFLPVCSPDRFWVVTSEKYVDTVRQQLPQIPGDQILAEPEARNTAPCIAYASWKIARKYPDANIVVTPADALVLKTAEFAGVIREALRATEHSDAIVTVGIAPTRPETGYGYIHASDVTRGKVIKVNAFKEKPDRKTAESYLSDGHYFWNAGIFVWNVRTIIAELRAHAPQIAGVMDTLAPSFYTEGESAALKTLFPTCEKVSIDYAVMEKSRNIHVVAEDLGWSDLGSWGSVRSHLPSDADGNAVVGGDVRLFGCKDCFVHTAGEKTVVVEGLEGYIVAEAAGRLLICRLSEEQRIKEFSAEKK
jgi:mannose-1-phosphate guanylyltransferase